MNNYLFNIMVVLNEAGFIDKEPKRGCYVLNKIFRPSEDVDKMEICGENGMHGYSGKIWRECYAEEYDCTEEYNIIGQIHLGHLIQWYRKYKHSEYLFDYKTHPMERDANYCKEVYLNMIEG